VLGFLEIRGAGNLGGWVVEIYDRVLGSVEFSVLVILGCKGIR
jgi:hypothetical protein